MNAYDFTEGVRRVLMAAREHAMELRHEYVGTEHILLGVLSADDGPCRAIFQRLGVDRAEIAQSVLETIRRGTRGTNPPDLPYTSRAKKALELSMSEARERRDDYLGSEHLLLGLLREEKGIAAQVLTHLGVTLEAVRTVGERVETATDGQPVPVAVRSVIVVVEGFDGQLRSHKFAGPAESIAFLRTLAA
jgi:ATP-dependent Clp protease ATP-binding subunit ClpC